MRKRPARDSPAGRAFCASKGIFQALRRSVCGCGKSPDGRFSLVRSQAQHNLKKNRAGSGARTNFAAQHVPTMLRHPAGLLRLEGSHRRRCPRSDQMPRKKILRRIRCRYHDGETHEIFTNPRDFDHCDGVSGFRADTAAGNPAAGH